MIRVALKCRSFQALLSDIKYIYYCGSLVALEYDAFVYSLNARAVEVAYITPFNLLMYCLKLELALSF
jgi:hypothetical protein